MTTVQQKINSVIAVLTLAAEADESKDKATAMRAIVTARIMLADALRETEGAK